MELRQVGRSELTVSAVGLGCNNFGWLIDEQTSIATIHKALDLGVTLFDTAPVYGAASGDSETVLGKALQGHRNEVTIVTKFGVRTGDSVRFDTSRAGILHEIDQSLTRLQTDHIDLYLLHWPDGRTPIEETLLALEELVTSGKVREIGTCNLPAWRLVEALWTSNCEDLPEFAVSQNEYSLVQRSADAELLPAIREYGLSFMPYTPLGNGLLTGKVRSRDAAPEGSRLAKNVLGSGDKYLTPQRLDLVQRLTRFAGERGHTLLELAFSWLLSNPVLCSVIAGATRPEQLEANVAAGSQWRLDADELAAVDAICNEAVALPA